jgi:hypothetical protein
MVQEMLQKTKIKTTYPCYILLKKGKQNKPWAWQIAALLYTVYNMEEY